MNVVVTGGCGTLGRWIVGELASSRGGRTPHHVTIFDRDRGEGRLPAGTRMVVGDHTELDVVRGALEGADVVVHLSGVRITDDGSADALARANVLGAENVHEAARQAGVRRVVTWSSVAALGWSGRNDGFLPQYLPVDEAHPACATDAYGLSKQTVEAIARRYTCEHGIDTLVMRAVWTVSPLEAALLWHRGGKNEMRWVHYAYLDVRDAATAARRAVEVAFSGHAQMYLAADDSCVRTPLAELLPRLRPELGTMASTLTGNRSAISNAHARSILGWAPVHDWRTKPSIVLRMRCLLEDVRA